MESIFPANRTELWKVLELHREDDAIRKIHPFVLSKRRTGADPSVLELERTLTNAGRMFSVTSTHETVPMEKFRRQITASTSGVSPESCIENKLGDTDDGKT